MKNRILYIWVAVFFTFIVSCDLFDDSPCGPDVTHDVHLIGSSVVDTAQGNYRSYMKNSERVFQYSINAEDICPDEHVKVEAKVALLDVTTEGIFSRARVSWLFLFEKQIPMTKDGWDVKGNGEAGLKQAFGEEPGWCTPILEVYFPTKGSYSADTAFFKANVVGVQLKATYREFKK